MNLSDALTLGPVRLPYWFFAVAVAALVLKLALRLTLKGEKAEASFWESAVWTGSLTGFLLWKASPLVVSFDTVLKEPAALLYLPGNLLGVFVGVLAAVGWVGWKLWHHQGEKRPVAKSLAFSLGVSLVSILAFASVLALVPRPVQESPVAAEADLVLPTLDGSAVSLTKAPGKVLFVNFWATWCPPCRAEIPGFVDYWKTAPRDAVEIRAVDLTTSERQPDLVRPFVAAEGMTFPVLLDPAGEAATRYQIESIPTTLVFDPQGQLVYRQVGVLSRDQMEALVRQYRP